MQFHLELHLLIGSEVVQCQGALHPTRTDCGTLRWWVAKSNPPYVRRRSIPIGVGIAGVVHVLAVLRLEVMGKIVSEIGDFLKQTGTPRLCFRLPLEGAWLLATVIVFGHVCHAGRGSIVTGTAGGLATVG